MDRKWRHPETVGPVWLQPRQVRTVLGVCRCHVYRYYTEVTHIDLIVWIFPSSLFWILPFLVMRVLGIPCRIVTNYNSAHDTNANLVIEEVYSETGQKLNLSRDSIWSVVISIRFTRCMIEKPL